MVIVGIVRVSVEEKLLRGLCEWNGSAFRENDDDDYDDDGNDVGLKFCYSLFLFFFFLPVMEGNREFIFDFDFGKLECYRKALVLE